MDHQKFAEFYRRTSTFPPPYRFDKFRENEAEDIRGHEITHVQNTSSKPNQFKKDPENDNVAHFIHPVVNQFNLSNLATIIELVEVTNTKIQQFGPQIREKALQVFFPTNDERPVWLPEDWRIEFKDRKSSTLVGKIDKYYIEPISGRRLRSKNTRCFISWKPEASSEEGQILTLMLARNLDILARGHKKKRSG